ncbi:hypothetical protein TH5N_00860 [Tetragenococcus halophilus]|uniref:hypothetical protein n=1 Tax=Tetragenococcus halophilus TaxID=51669 RepID=UPI00192597EB|nr:hypothetical protein [Tetragenococcus halophilus]MDN5830520.1 hypothetical protein [Tetragenococcus halophilus]MDN6265194.1 hypothetical protein [Tetragenococcus halophilus]GEQ36960.1 hypothetical protein TH3N_00860 [Tetragenococcus halophilus]GEQ39208.1 hypothetical protein TH5N_00860 [Tetragenococcus halophilus]GEQ41421.1 hypothetical protein TH6N_00470 [Tetragenococcus halophilus]
MSSYVKRQRTLVLFGFLTLLVIIWEYFIGLATIDTTFTKIVECSAGILLIYAPEILNHFFRLKFANFIVYFFWFFIFLAIFLGNCLHFMTLIPLWDKLLHLVSPMILTAIGYGILSEFLKGQNITARSPWLFLIFGFSFAGICGVFWEFWEWSWDMLLDMNLQRYKSGNTVFVGRRVLQDTMGDLLINVIGSFLLSFFAWYKSRYNSAYFEKFRVQFLNS